MRSPARGACAAARPMLAALGLLAAPAVSAAQEVRVPGTAVVDVARPVAPAPPLATPEVTLAEAVRLALAHDPEGALARQDSARAAGLVREARAAFDPILAGRTSLGWSHTPIQPFLRARENRKRLQLELLATAYSIVDRELRAAMAGLAPRPPRCPVGFDLQIRDQSIRIDRQDPLERSLMGVQRDLGDAVAAQLRAGLGGVGVANVCAPASDLQAPQEASLGFYRGADTAAGGTLGLNPLLANLPQHPHELLAAQQQIAHTIATRAALGRARIDVVPAEEVRRDVAIEASLGKPFRNGWFVSGELRLLSQQHTFVDKPLDPSFGGSDQPILFPSYVTLGLTVPLGRGGGRLTVEAPERAAALQLRAARARLRHTLTERAFGTVLAYLGLVAAQERLRHLEESAARQRDLVALTEQLVTAGELARLDLDRAQARAAEAASAASQGRIARAEAQVALARAMGVDVLSPEALPVASDAFTGTVKAAPGVAAMVGRAVAARQDRRALHALREAAGVLAAAARADLRPRYDLTISGGLSNTYDNPLFRFMPDELHPIYSDFAPIPAPGQAPTRFATPRGFYRSVSGRWEPFLGVQMSYELPRGNRAWLGRSLQMESQVRRSAIELEDLDRVVRDAIAAASGALDAAAATIERRQVVIARQQETLAGTLEQFRAGEATLLDVIVTEDALTREQVQLVADRLAYFGTLARLQFEAGELLRVEDEGLDSETLVFAPGAFVTR